MMQFKKTLLLLYILLAVGTVANAASVNIRGRVVDQADEPVIAASVKVAGTSVGTVTNTDGNYKLSIAQQDTIVIVFSCIGYNDERRTLIRPSGDLTLNMRLREKSVELEGVVVTEIRRQTDAMQQMSTSVLMGLI